MRANKAKIIFLIRKIVPERHYYLLVDFYLKWRYFFLSFEFTGSEFECPFCGKRLRKFLPDGVDLPVLREKNVVGGGDNLSERCPRCRSLARERLIYLYLKNKTNLFEKKLKLLHIAPEKELGKVLKASPNIDYLSADLNSPLAMVKMDITNINYRNNFFDVIICSHVLEHIPNDRRAMSELWRVLKPGGWTILQVPISLSLKKTYENPAVKTPEEREIVFGQSDHVRIYGWDYKRRLEKVGFRVQAYSFIKEFGKASAHKYGLLKDENIYICSKLA